MLLFISKKIPLLFNGYVKNSLYTDKSLYTGMKTFSNFVNMLIHEEGITDKRDIMFEISNRIYEYDDDNSDKVELTTIHQYKGLENKVVFVTGMSDVPQSISIDESTYPMMYVALSRPTDKLYYVDYLHKRKMGYGLVSVERYPKFADCIKLLKQRIGG